MSPGPKFQMKIVENNIGHSDLGVNECPKSVWDRYMTSGKVSVLHNVPSPISGGHEICFCKKLSPSEGWRYHCQDPTNARFNPMGILDLIQFYWLYFGHDLLSMVKHTKEFIVLCEDFNETWSIEPILPMIVR